MGGLKIVVNTNYESAGTRVCVDGLIPRLRSAGHQVVQGDWGNYQRYDVALFMSPDAEVKQAKEQQPGIVCGIMDPKIDYNYLRQRVRAADFCVVSSIEQRDALYEFNRQVFIYYMFPDIPILEKTHEQKTPTVIGYHGNKEHLDCLSPNVTRALEALGKKYPIQFWAMYNVKKLGKWKSRLSNVTVRHIQWSEANYRRELAKVDIGIVNNEIPVTRRWSRNWLGSRWYVYGLKRYPTRPLDTVSRYKYSTNPGRIYVFAQLGIPVVSDFAPSANQFIRDGKTGYIAHTKFGWYRAMESLVMSPLQRQLMSDGLRDYIAQNCSIDQNFETLNREIMELVINNGGRAQ